MRDCIVLAQRGRTKNPIRAIVDNLKTKPNPEKPLISLSIGKHFVFLSCANVVGDPTVFGNFEVPTSVNEELTKSVQSRKFNGKSFGVTCVDYVKDILTHVAIHKHARQ